MATKRGKKKDYNGIYRLRVDGRETGPYWISWSIDGKRFRRSTDSEKITEAQRQRNIEIGRKLEIVNPDHRDVANKKLVTVADLIALALEHVQGKSNGYAPKTYSDYVNYWNRFKHLLGHKPADITGPQMAKILREFNADNDKQVSGATLNHWQNLILTAYRVGRDEGVIPESLKPSFTRYKTVARQHEITPSDIAALTASLDKLYPAAEHPEPHAQFIIARNAGLRHGNLVNLQYSMIDFSNGKLVIPAADTKNGDELVVYLNSACLAAIATLPTYAKRVGYLFKNRYSVRSWWDSIREDSKVDAHFHDFRFEFGSRLRALGTPLEYVGTALGHKPVTTTEKYYARPSFAILASWVEKLAGNADVSNNTLQTVKIRSTSLYGNAATSSS